MPLVRILQDIAGLRTLWETGDVVEMTPEDANVWADGIRGELVRPATDEVETPERGAPSVERTTTTVPRGPFKGRGR